MLVSIIELEAAYLVEVCHRLGDEEGGVPSRHPGLLARPLAESHAAVGAGPGSNKNDKIYSSQHVIMICDAKLTLVSNDPDLRMRGNILLTSAPGFTASTTSDIGAGVRCRGKR